MAIVSTELKLAAIIILLSNYIGNTYMTQILKQSLMTCPNSFGIALYQI
jgi:hypothetical protein